jgi:hypothetical protein
MTVSLELPAEIEAELVARARENGLPLEAYLQQILRERAGAAFPPKARSRMAGDRIRELRKGVTLGGISIKELIEEGRE